MLNFIITILLHYWGAYKYIGENREGRRDISRNEKMLLLMRSKEKIKEKNQRKKNRKSLRVTTTLHKHIKHIKTLQQLLLYYYNNIIIIAYYYYYSNSY